MRALAPFRLGDACALLRHGEAGSDENGEPLGADEPAPLESDEAAVSEDIASGGSGGALRRVG